MPELAPYFDQPKGSEGEKLAALEAMYKAADAMRQPHEAIWANNILALDCQHWEEAAQDMRTFNRRIPVYVPSTKVRLAFAGVYMLLRQAAAAISQNRATQVAVPATSDQADKEAAEIATMRIAARDYEDNEAELVFNEEIWRMTCGSVYSCVTWDPDASGTSVSGKVVPRLGDVKRQTIDPWHIHVCPYSTCMENPEWLIYSDIWSVEQVNDTFKKDVKEESVAESMRLFDNLQHSILLGNVGTAPPKRKGAVLVKKLWRRPSPDFPAGREIVFCSTAILDEGELPEGEMPTVRKQWFVIPAKAYALAFVTPIRPIQRYINILMSQYIELANRKLRGDIATKGRAPTEDQQELITYRWDKETGAKFVYIDPGVLEWQFMDYNLDPTAAESMLARLWNEEMSAAGVHEPTTGAAPPSQTTATQILTLKESDFAGLSPFRNSGDLSNGKSARLKVIVERNHVKTPRLSRLVGEDMIPKVSVFLGSDMRSTDDVRPRSIPITTQAMEITMRRDAAIAGLYNWDGAMPEDMQSKITALLASGIPNIEEEINRALAPMTIDDLQRICGEIRAVKIEAALIAAHGLKDQAVIAKAQQEQTAQQILGGGGQPETSPQVSPPANPPPSLVPAGGM